MQVREHAIGVCSWSLHPQDSADLVVRVKEVGLEHMQLGLGPILKKENIPGEIQAIRDSGLALTATALWFDEEDYSTIAMARSSAGFAPDQHWPRRKELTLAAAKLTAELGAKYLTCHSGFVSASSDRVYAVLLERVREVAEALAEMGVDLLIETGPEPASALLQFLNDLNARNVGVNYDPANMILYGSGDPIASIPILGRHIKHVHVKDAIASQRPRMDWGREVALGSGEVKPLLLLDELEEIGYAGPLCIEREARDHSLMDIRAAIRALKEVE